MDMILPVVTSILLVMLLGYGLSKKLLADTGFWQGISRLAYWVLFPLLIVRTLAQATIDTQIVLPLVSVLVVALVVGLAYSLIMSRLLGQDGPSASSMVQGGVRHNGFIGLAVLFDMFGMPGQEMGALIIAVLVPPTNVLCVFAVSLLTRKQQSLSVPKLIIKELSRNPQLIAVGGGLLLNYFSVSIPGVLDQSIAILSRAALPMLLLSVGASLQIRALKGNWPVLAVALSTKLIVFPALMLAGSLWLQLPPLATVSLVVFGALPTAVSAFPFAQQMGGNAKLMADIITLQTVASLIGLTFWASVAMQVTGFSL
ncbi:MAG: AEC family transporter [Oceanospirillaceae bacterium]|jgi:hypothetical protein|nr:AEC family transporter [Oceanospirillaceae bacterium]